MKTLLPPEHWGSLPITLALQVIRTYYDLLAKGKSVRKTDDQTVNESLKHD